MSKSPTVSVAGVSRRTLLRLTPAATALAAGTKVAHAQAVIGQDQSPLFVDLAGSRATPVSTIVKSAGFAARGEGAADYILDESLSDAYVRANPRTSFMSARGVFRLDAQQRLTIQMFGGRADGTSNPTTGPIEGEFGATDNSAALLAALGFLDANRITIGNDHYYRAGPIIHFPAADGVYDFRSTINIKTTVILTGHSNAMASGIGGSQLRWPPGMHAIIVHQPQTVEGGTASQRGFGGGGTILQGLNLVQHRNGNDMIGQDFHGIWLRARATIRDFTVTGFSGNGIHIVAGAGAGGMAEGNANCFSIENGICYGCENGIFIDGGDANASRILGVDASVNRGYGIWDSSFLGNLIMGCHADGNGLLNSPGNVSGSVANHRGFNWGVHAGQASAAASTEPGTDSRVWVRISPYADAVPSIYPAWRSGMSWREGGAYRVDSPAGNGNLLLGCYSEANNGASYVVPPALVIGGTHGAPVYGGGTHLSGASGQGRFNAAVASEYWPGGDDIQRVSLGHDPVFGDIFALADTRRLGGTVGVPVYVRFGWGGAIGPWSQDFIWNQGYALATARVSYFVTGPNTARTFGRDTAQPNLFGADEIAIGSSGRIHQSGSAPPRTGNHAKGEICWNDHTDSSQDAVDYWICKTEGSPGRWVARP